jgi:glycosyltransferase involved in cell wall biosynthesis
MRVGIDVRSSRGRKTGIGFYVHNLVNGLQEHGGLQVSLYGLKGDSDLNTPQRMFWENFTLPSEIRKDELDIFHFPGFAGSMGSGKHKKVTTVCDLIGMIYPRNLAPVSRFYWQKWLPACIKNSDALIAISEHTKADIVRILGIPENKIHVTLLAADSVFRPMYDAERLKTISQKYRLPKNFMLTLGTVEPRKNLSRLVKAFTGYVRRTESDLHLLIAGKADWGYQEVAGVVGEEGVESKVKFTGYVDDEDMPGLYNLAKFFAYPSLYEGFGLPLLEALSCGRSVMCSNTSSLPEVAGDAALYVDPLDVKDIERAIERFDIDARAREDFSNRAVLQAAKFSWKKTADKTIDVYKEVLGG